LAIRGCDKQEIFEPESLIQSYLFTGYKELPTKGKGQGSTKAPPYMRVKRNNNKPLRNDIAQPTRDVSHCDLAIYIKKYLKAKEELWKLKYISMQKHNLQKIL
jgi:hypothetical protein